MKVAKMTLEEILWCNAATVIFIALVQDPGTHLLMFLKALGNPTGEVATNRVAKTKDTIWPWHN